MNFIDLRSDTVTNPTEEMRKAMFSAEVGDDVYGDDPTVKELEIYAAKLVGKEAALFVPSGTFGNQLCLFTHCNRGDEVILGDDCHIIMHEVGAASVIAGVQLRTINTHNGMMDTDEIQKKIRTAEEDIHYPGTSLICIENAYSNGIVTPISYMQEVFSIAKENNLKVHLDGARLFNAATYLKVDPKELTKYCDSVMFCLSKGLCAPVGSIVAGDKIFIDRARKKRKLMGGGLRQIGILAAAGLVALKSMTKRLSDDHKNALILADELSKIPGFKVLKDDVQINMVFFNMQDSGISGEKLKDKLLDKGIKINPPENGLMRFVTHYWIKEKDVYYIIKCIKDFV